MLKKPRKMVAILGLSVLSCLGPNDWWTQLSNPLSAVPSCFQPGVWLPHCHRIPGGAVINDRLVLIQQIQNVFCQTACRRFFIFRLSYLFSFTMDLKGDGYSSKIKGVTTKQNFYFFNAPILRRPAEMSDDDVLLLHTTIMHLSIKQLCLKRTLCLNSLVSFYGPVTSNVQAT